MVVGLTESNRYAINAKVNAIDFGEKTALPSREFPTAVTQVACSADGSGGDTCNRHIPAPVLGRRGPATAPPIPEGAFPLAAPGAFLP